MELRVSLDITLRRVQTDNLEAVALVLGNWHNVLRAISMAACKPSSTPLHRTMLTVSAKIPAPQNADEQREEQSNELPLPQALVRIPTEQAPIIQQHQDAAKEAEEEKSQLG